MAIKKYSKEDIEKMDDLTDYERVEKMTEKEIKENAESDLDAPLQSEEDLKRFKPAKKHKGHNHDNN